MLISGFKEILHKYDLFIVDVWGVLYSEGAAGTFPCVIPLLEEISRLNKKLTFLSNAPRLVSHLISNMEKLHIPPTLYTNLHTSGMETKLLFEENAFRNLGSKCYLLGVSRGLVEESGYIEVVDNLDNADFVIFSSLDVRDDLNYYSGFLDKLIARKLPVLCPNPDVFVTDNTGKKLFCQGALAAMYENMGGYVKYVGKPHKEVYDRIFSWHPDITKDKIVVVGDNLDTDIKGGNMSGVDSVFIANGMYASQLHDINGNWIQENFDKLLESSKVTPTYVSEWFSI